MQSFLRDYYHLHMQGNDTVTQLSNTEFFKFMTYTFDERAKYGLNASYSKELSLYLKK